MVENFELNKNPTSAHSIDAANLSARVNSGGETDLGALDKTSSPANKQQKSSEVPLPSQSNLESKPSQSPPADVRPVPAAPPERSAPVAQQPLPHETPGDPAILVPQGIGRPSEALPTQTVPKLSEGLQPLNAAESPLRDQNSSIAQPPVQKSFLPENLIAQRPKDSDGSLVITPLQEKGYSESRLGNSTVPPIDRTKITEAQPQPSPAKISLGELAAKLNQDDLKQPISQPSSRSEAIDARSNERIQTTEKGLSIPGGDSTRAAVTNETAKTILDSSDHSRRHEIPLVNPVAQAVPSGSEKSLPAVPPPALAGQVSITRDNSQDASAATIANRPGSISPDRPGVSDKLRSDVVQKSRIDTNLTERSSKVDVGKIETIDARTAKTEGAAVSSSAADAIKSNRAETISTDKPNKTDKVDATKPLGDIKTRAEMGNQTKREPLIIPGVITSRTSDSGKGGKGTKADGSGKPDTKSTDTKTSDTTKIDGKKVDGGIAGVKNGGTASDVVSGKKDHIKVDKSEGKVDQHPDTKIAASASNVISGVAGRIVDGFATIKDKLIPGAKTNVDSRSDKVDGHPEFANHSAQPKPNDANLGIGRDLKILLPSSSGEFIYNGKKPLAESREDTLSSKTGGLKQALVQIFGNRPDIVADLKANTFPGPKTVPFENAQSRAGDRQPPKVPDGADKLDHAYLRNQKGDKVPTGNLREQLAELKASSDSTKLHNADTELENDGIEVDSTNRQQIKDFTVQLGEIAKGSVSVPTTEFFTADDTTEEIDQAASDDDEYDSRYLYYVKEGDTLRSIFDSQLPHEIGNESVFEYFVKTNEQTVRLASALSADSMSFALRPGTVLKLPTPRQIAQLKAV
ncbi:MAG: hypothetical protein P4L53_07680 [Candidatus Obscuribacterales bacterium]|nr:hypothetical protein [Candidatus Obscuribacterales bacterium]